MGRMRVLSAAASLTALLFLLFSFCGAVPEDGTQAYECGVSYEACLFEAGGGTPPFAYLPFYRAPGTSVKAMIRHMARMLCLLAFSNLLALLCMRRGRFLCVPRVCRRLFEFYRNRPQFAPPFSR